mgnify:CR=1 FL=1
MKFIIAKSLGIAYVTALYFTLGGMSSIMLNQLIPKLEDSDNDVRIVGEIILNFMLIAVVYYFLRRMVKNLPYPLDGKAGLNYGDLREIRGGVIIAFTIFVFQKRLASKLNYIIEKYNLM